MTAGNRSPGNCAGVSNTLFYRCRIRTELAHRLSLTLFSCWLATACLVEALAPLTLSLRHHLHLAASLFVSHFQSRSDVNAKTIKWKTLTRTLMRLNLWVKFLPFATLCPGKQILKMSLLSGVFFSMHGHNLSGEDEQRYLWLEKKRKAILGWSFIAFQMAYSISLLIGIYVLLGFRNVVRYWMHFSKLPSHLLSEIHSCWYEDKSCWTNNDVGMKETPFFFLFFFFF